MKIFLQSFLLTALLLSLASATQIPVVIETKTTELIPATLTETEIKQIEQLALIKNIESVPRFSASLQDSAPLINATQTHTLQQNATNLTGVDQTICVIDSGIDLTHPELAAKNLTCVIDCYNKDCTEDCTVLDDDGHGTHVAGIITSAAGIAPEVKIIGLKVLDENGNSHPTTGSLDIKNAIEWCTTNRVSYNISVITMSLGTATLFQETCDASFSSTLTPAINNATLNNITVVAATGNSGPGIPRNTTAISSPACITNTTAVSATNKDDTIASYGHYNNLTDFFAPGTSINATLAGGGYTILSGTSMATPHVTAAAAIIKQFTKLQNVQIQPAPLITALKNNGKNISTPEGYNITRINIFDTILSLDTQSPIVSLETPADNQVSPIQNRTFACNAIDLRLANITFFLWNQTSSILNQTTQALAENSHAFTHNVSNLSSGTYHWNCRYQDYNNNNAFASANFTFEIGGILTTLAEPNDNTFTNQANTNFTCQANSEETIELINTTFFLWNSTELIYQETQNISGTSNTSIFNTSLPAEINYHWNCRAINNNSNATEALTNYSLTYDATQPNITLIAPADSFTATGTQEIMFQYNATDNFNLTQCSLILNNQTVATNSSSLNQSRTNNITYSVSSGSYVWQINCTDVATNLGNSSERAFIINSPPAASSTSGGGGGGGGGATTIQTFTPTDTQLSSGYTRELKKTDKVKIAIFDSASEEHTLTINQVNANSVNVTIQSDPIHIMLGIGQSIKLNLTSFEFYDLYIKLNAIENSRADLTIQTIFEQILRQEPIEESEQSRTEQKNTTQEPADAPMEDTKPTINTTVIILVVVILILLIIIFLYIKSRKQLKKEITKEVRKDLKKK